MDVVVEFKEQSVFRMEESSKRILACLALVPENKIWEKPNAASNSIGNLVLHLCGNMTQYILSTLGGAADLRNRDAEFAAQGGFSKQGLQELFEGVIHNCVAVIQQCSYQDLTTIKNVQVYSLSGIGIIIHVTEHLSYHTGQIALLTKLITEKDLGFYAGLDLNKKQIL